MQFPKLVYDDFYKFVTSFTLFTFLFSIYASYYQIAKSKMPNISQNEIDFLVVYFYVFLLFTLISAVFFIWAIFKWKKNQNFHDRKLEADTIISEQTAERMLKPSEVIYDDSSKLIGSNNSKTALVSYKIASVLPNTIHFDFLKDWKVWFWIGNHETKKYRAYVKIKFIAPNFNKEISEGYYGGTKAWNLNALSGIQAPGLGIPDEIKKATKSKKKIEILINCEVKDENDKLIEKKLPQSYIYDYKNNNWYLDP